MPSSTHPIRRLFGAPRRNRCKHRASFCPGSARSQRGCTEHGTNVLQHRQKIQQHERVFLVWFQCGERTHIPNMSPSVEVYKSPGGIKSEQCPAIHQRGVRCLHQGKAQDAASGLLTVWVNVISRLMLWTPIPVVYITATMQLLLHETPRAPATLPQPASLPQPSVRVCSKCSHFPTHMPSQTRGLHQSS
jgi:hypothetical protein